MATKVYGASDDLIEFEGDVAGEVGAYGTDDKDHGVLLVFSDGTMLEVSTARPSSQSGASQCWRAGMSFRTSSTVRTRTRYHTPTWRHFGLGLKWCYAAKEWERVS